MEPVTWFAIIFLVVFKIPALYLCYVVWWAVKDPPLPGEDDEQLDERVQPDGPEPRGSWWRRRAPRKPLRHGPHGSPERRPEPARTKARWRPPA